MNKSLIRINRVNIITLLIITILLLSTVVSTTAIHNITTQQDEEAESTKAALYEHQSRPTAPKSAPDTPGVPILIEDFEDITMPPPGWTHQITNTEYTWHIYDKDPYEGDYFANCFWDPYLHQQDEWLITPSLDFSGYHSGIYLSFRWAMSYYWGVTEDSYDFNVKISTDGGSTWALLWNEDTIGSFTDWTWYDTTFNTPVDLSDYADKTHVMIAFQYEGINGGQLKLDFIEIYACAAHDVGVTQINNPFGTLTAGNITPSITLKNFGANDEPEVPVNLKIVKKFIVGDTEDFEHDILGDLNHDGEVNDDDYNVFNVTFGLNESHPDFNPEADYNNNGIIDSEDYQMWLIYLNEFPIYFGDLNYDGIINETDYLLFLAAFGHNISDPEYNPEADYNGNGIIDSVDYQIWLMHYRNYNDRYTHSVGPRPETWYGTIDDWEWGKPTYEDGPATAYSDNFCWGTNLDGDISAYGNMVLDSIAINLSNITAVIPESAVLRLEFYHWYDFSSTSSLALTGGNVKISTDAGDTWTTITPIGGYPVQEFGTYNRGIAGDPGYGKTRTDTWMLAGFDLSEYMNETVQFRWHCGSYSSYYCRAGWYIDNVRIVYDDVNEEYNETIPINISFRGNKEVTFPEWTPNDWQNIEDENIEYDITACTQLYSDEDYSNDYLGGDVTLHFPFFNDTGVISINNPVGTTTADTITPEITVANFGQYDQYGAPVKLNINKIYYNHYFQKEDFESGLPGGWTVIDGGNTNDTWTDSNPGERTPEGGCEGTFMIADCDHADEGVFMSESLITPSFSCYYDWPMHRNNIMHTGFVQSSAPNSNTSRWTSYLGTKLESSPIVADGRLYIGSKDNNLYCLNALNGTPIWNYTTNNRIGYSSPAVYNDSVYTGSTDGKLYCLDALDGMWKWEFQTDGPIFSSPIIVESHVYFGSHDGKIYCVSTETGLEKWNFTTDERVTSSPAIVDGRVYIGSIDGKMYCLNASDGKHIWNFTTLDSISYSSPTVVNNRVYFGSWDYNVYCINAIDGNFIWRFNTNASVLSSPAVAYGYVYIGSYDNKIYCLPEIDPNSNGIINDSEIIWEYETGGRIFSSPAVADGKVYVGSRDGIFYCINATNGNLFWDYEATGVDGIGSSPAIADGIVYMASTNGNVYAFGNQNKVVLAFGQFYNYVEDDYAEVAVSNDGGANWTIVATYTTDTWGPTTIDISSIASGYNDVKIRFYYYGAFPYVWYWMIDNIEVYSSNFEVEYQHIEYVDLLAGETKKITFPGWTPSDITLGSIEIDYTISATTQLDDIEIIDKGTTNNLKTDQITLIFIDNVGVETITQPTPPIPLRTIFTEGFEDPWISDSDGDLAPPGWENHITDYTDTGPPNHFPHFWGRYGTIPYYGQPAEPYNGSYHAFLHWSLNHQDEWLITPVLDLFQYDNNQLTFWRYGQTGSTHNDHYYVRVSPTGGFEKEDFTDIIWDASDLPEGNNKYDTPYVLDLSAYDGTSIRIAWHNVDGSSDDGLWFGNCIDDVLITGEIAGAYPAGTYPIEAIVKNHGTYFEDFDVNAKIYRTDGLQDELIYESNTTITDVASDATEIAVFDDWTLTDLGIYRLEIKTQLPGDSNPEDDIKIKIIRADFQPPVTTPIINGPLGENGWYTDKVIVSLEATDDLSGVLANYYKIDEGEWKLYTNPFKILTDGIHTVEYYSVDYARNIEDEQSITIKIDQVPPTIILNKEIRIDRVIFTAEVSDETSGVDRVEFYLEDETGFYTATEEPYEWILIPIPSEELDVTAIVYDMAGNSNQDIVPVSHSFSTKQSSSSPETYLKTRGISQ